MKDLQEPAVVVLFAGPGGDGKLTGVVCAMPYGVALFDNVEKAHPRVLDSLLRAFDDGTPT